MSRPAHASRRGKSQMAPTPRGLRTQLALQEAALQLMQEGRNFNSLSLREVAQKAGVVPTAFYRHYRDMDELALAVVDRCGTSLRDLLRKVRLESAGYKDIIRGSAITYKKYVEAHPRYFAVAAGERHGGAPIIRAAIQHEVQRFVEEMAQDLERLNLLPNMSAGTLRNVCDLVVSTMLSAASDILDLPKKGQQFEHERMERYVQQLRIIFFGAAMWREKPDRAAKRRRA